MKTHSLASLAGCLIFAITLTLVQGTPARAQAVGPAWTYTGNLNRPRYEHTATLLSNGKVLVAGGVAYGVLSSAELYDPVSGAWSLPGNLNAPRYRHTATLLPNGKVLVTGGFNDGFQGPVGSPRVAPLNSAELYDPATGTWSLINQFNGDFQQAEMVKAFLSSIEYRHRFGP